MKNSKTKLAILFASMAFFSCEKENEVTKSTVKESTIGKLQQVTLHDGKPFTIISNGQIDTVDGIAHIVEDINKDANSLYFLSDHKVPLIAAKYKKSFIQHRTCTERPVYRKSSTNKWRKAVF